MADKSSPERVEPGAGSGTAPSARDSLPGKIESESESEDGRAGVSKGAPERGARKSEGLEAELARAFAGQKNELEDCFRQHAAGPGQAPSLSVRLSLKADGAVAAARVMPEKVAETPLGGCIEQASRRMAFGRLKEPISFTIPLTARRGR